MNENEKLIQSIIEAIQEKKGRNIVHVDLTGIETAAAQGFVIATGNTPMQVGAIADSVREYVEKMPSRGHSTTMDIKMRNG